MTQYRATRTERQVGVGNFTRSFERGEIVESGDARGQVPQYICDYLESHGILVNARIVDGPLEGPRPPASPTPPAPKAA